MRMSKPIIFDFDGVIADSEALANTLLADFLTAEGMPTTLDDSMRLFMGRRWSDNIPRLEAHLGRPWTADMEARHRHNARVRMRAEVEPVAGVLAFIATLPATPKCIASSSSPEWLTDMTKRFGIHGHFADRLFSGTQVPNGKPAPDLFFHAARGLAAHPESCIVIEDSPAGITAARAAGMTAIGLLAGSHIRPGHAEKLAAAGAHHLCHSFSDVARILGV
jgi:HAD superfamily hydrolase (TIGR01509 family)